MVQPASVDVRLDRFFRLFDNHNYPYIDPAQDQDGLTRMVDVEPDQAFILHPGEFVLGSTFEQVTLADDVAARLEGKSSLGRLGLLTHSTRSEERRVGKECRARGSAWATEDERATNVATRTRDK